MPSHHSSTAFSTRLAGWRLSVPDLSSVLLAGSTLQRLRLFSRLILFAFALTHFLNHAVGLIGVEAMEAVQEWRTAITRSWVGSAVLIGALATHVILALYRIVRRATLRMPAWELVQIATARGLPDIAPVATGPTTAINSAVNSR